MKREWLYCEWLSINHTWSPFNLLCEELHAWYGEHVFFFYSIGTFKYMWATVSFCQNSIPIHVSTLHANCASHSYFIVVKFIHIHLSNLCGAMLFKELQKSHSPSRFEIPCTCGSHFTLILDNISFPFTFTFQYKVGMQM